MLGKVHFHSVVWQKNDIPVINGEITIYLFRIKITSHLAIEKQRFVFLQ